MPERADRWGDFGAKRGESPAGLAIVSRMRSVRKVGMWVLLAQVAWSLPTAIFMWFLWLDSNEPDTSSACSVGGVCSSGTTAYFVMTLCFGGVALVALAIMGVLALRWRGQARTRARLLTIGMRTPGLLVDMRPTNTRINDQQVLKLIFESRATGRSIQVAERSMTPLPIGTPVTIVYDPADPSRAVLAEDIETILSAARNAADQARQAWVNAMFAQPQPQPQPASGGISAIRDAVANNLETALAELRAQVETGQITQAEYDHQRQMWLHLLETRTDQPLT